MRVLEFNHPPDEHEPFEMDPDAIESVKARVAYNIPVEGETTGVVDVTMRSGEMHRVFVGVWEGEPESSDVLDAWVQIVETERAAVPIEPRSFRDRAFYK